MQSSLHSNISLSGLFGLPAVILDLRLRTVKAFKILFSPQLINIDLYAVHCLCCTLSHD